MPPFNHGAFIAEMRRLRGSVPTDLYNDMMQALDAGLATPAPAKASPSVPVGPDALSWMLEAASHMGEKEIVGPKHSPFILGMIKKLGGWFTDDETPWCGTFVAYCLKVTGHEVPSNWFRALVWADWGKAAPETPGAIAVFGRAGGGHVGFLVGASTTHYYVLGGNQSNAVNIMPIDKKRLVALRWPGEIPFNGRRLVAMTGGTVSRNEA